MWLKRLISVLVAVTLVIGGVDVPELLADAGCSGVDSSGTCSNFESCKRVAGTGYTLNRVLCAGVMLGTVGCSALTGFWATAVCFGLGTGIYISCVTAAGSHRDATVDDCCRTHNWNNCIDDNTYCSEWVSSCY